MDAWRASTKQLYTTYLKKWAVFCVSHGVSLLQPKLPEACRFLRLLAEGGLGYGAVNAARSALSAILGDFEGRPFGKHPIVCWLVKGVYERKPPQPRYASFWDVNKVLDMFKTWGRNPQLSLKKLTLKLVLLLLLVTSQRGQTIHLLNLDGLELHETAVFKLQRLLKHNRLGDPLSVLVLKPFDQCYRLCVVRALKEYLKRTKSLRKGASQLLISFRPPHKPISRDTLSRWVLTSMSMAGIDIKRFKSHSTRGASTSAAKRLGVSVNLILKHAGWKKEDSFATYYNKDIERDDAQVGNVLLRGAVWIHCKYVIVGLIPWLNNWRNKSWVGKKCVA